MERMESFLLTMKRQRNTRGELVKQLMSIRIMGCEIIDSADGVEGIAAKRLAFGAAYFYSNYSN